MLDTTDRALIALLRENARIGHAEAARRLRLSRTTVQARVESLERRGVIAGYTLRLAEEVASRMVRAHVTIVVAPKASGGVVSALQRMPELRALQSVAGVFER
jgi:DNA-binding Lrp family transcriptional regulator